jgi:hypothetical protein
VTYYTTVHTVGGKSMQYYLLTAWSIAILEKLTSFQLGKKFPAFYGTQKFITAVTSS